MPLFISYSQKDQGPYTSLCLALESEKLDYWSSQTMKVGNPLKDQLREAIKNCGVCIFIATRSSVISPWCLVETGAFWGAEKRIILYKANPDIDERKLPPIFQGDLWTCDVREVIRQAKEALENNKIDPLPVESISEEQDAIPNNAEERFSFLTSKEKEVLQSYIEKDTRTRRLRYDDGVVVGLIQRGILYYASNRAVSFMDPFNYYTEVNMKLWAWQYLNSHLELLVEDKAHNNEPE